MMDISIYEIEVSVMAKLDYILRYYLCTECFCVFKAETVMHC